MASQRVIEASVRTREALSAEVELVLGCGCRVVQRVPLDRLLDTPDGLLVVGKYPCPEAHPLARV